MAIFEIINATDSLIQNMYVYGEHAELRTPIYQIRLVFHTPYLWNEAGDSQFLFHFWNK